MSFKKELFIKEICDGQIIRALFLVKEASRGETKNGKPYLMLTLADKTGEIAGRVWENADQLLDYCTVGGFINITAQAQEFRGSLQLRITDVTPVDPAGVDLSLFLPASPFDIEEMATELRKTLKRVKDKDLRDLLQKIFKDSTFFDRFKHAPAAKNMHHAYIGGLLEHTLAVARLAENVAVLYPTIDSSLLIAGALLHDIGKVEEFAFVNNQIDYSDRGRLVGHMTLGLEMLQEKVRSFPGFPEEVATRIKHLILSHHGRHDYGSPVLPMMLEAFVLNLIDDLDAKVNYVGRLGSQARSNGYQWTDYQRTLERFLFVQGHGAREDNLPGSEAEPPFEETPSRQRTLF